MRNLTIDEQKTISVIIQQTSKQRRALETVDTDTRDARFFRSQAEHHSRVIVIHHATGRQIPEESREFLHTYLDAAAGDFDQVVTEFIRALEKATGRALEY